MSLIRSGDSTPERIVRHYVHKFGFRYKLHDRSLPGTPDLVFPSRRKIIFVNGCFWHRHNGCALARLPKSRPEFWIPKLTANKARDERVLRQLRRAGWSVLVIWECELRDPFKLMFKTLLFLEK